MSETIGDNDIEFDEVALRALGRVNANRQSAQTLALKKARAWSVDENTSDGALLLELIRELRAQPIVHEHKKPSLLLPQSLNLSICPRPYEDEPTIFEVPEGARLVKHHKNEDGEKYEIVVDGTMVSICFTFTRYGRLKLGRHPGFRKDRQRATFHPTIGATMRPVISAS